MFAIANFLVSFSLNPPPTHPICTSSAIFVKLYIIEKAASIFLKRLLRSKFENYNRLKMFILLNLIANVLPLETYDPDADDGVSTFSGNTNRYVIKHGCFNIFTPKLYCLKLKYFI